MSQLKDIPYDSVISYDYHFAVVLAFINIIGTIIQLLVVISIFREGWRNLTVSTMFVLSVSCADILFLTNMSIIDMINVSSKGWAVGPTGCLINALLTILSCCLSILSLALLTYDRYSVLLKTLAFRLTKKSALICITVIWIASPILCCYVLYTNAYQYIVGIGSSKHVCTLAWWAKEPLTIFGIIVCLVALLGVFIFVVFAYTSICWYYIKMKREHQKNAVSSLSKKTTDHRSTPSASPPTLSPEEIKLLSRAIAVTGTYFICWTPYLVKIFLEISTNQPSSSAFDTLSNIFVGMYPSLTGIYLIMFDARIKRNAKKLLAVEEINEFLKKAFKAKKPKATSEMHLVAISVPNLQEQAAIRNNAKTVIIGGTETIRQ